MSMGIEILTITTPTETIDLNLASDGRPGNVFILHHTRQTKRHR